MIEEVLARMDLENARFALWYAVVNKEPDLTPYVEAHRKASDEYYIPLMRKYSGRKK